MRFVIDHDYHLHTNLSSCCHEEEQTTERLLRYAEKNGLRDICLTNHFWDDTVCQPTKWYAPQNFAHIASARPLPQSDKVRFHFGCEGDMNERFIIGIGQEVRKEMELLVVPFTHMHMKEFVPTETSVEERANLYVQRMDVFMGSDLPDGKTGIAHMTTPLIARAQWTDHIRLLEMIPDDVFRYEFSRAAQRNFGIELNMDLAKYAPEELQSVLRPYFIAKECGCKFYLGSDAHSAAALEGAMKRFEDMVSALDLTEEDKFCPFES
ncbi:MAG: hypothetical protein IJC19_08160 [Clostridia bacterium]|nr:hypothetical protein [Clostridia bacterium]